MADINDSIAPSIATVIAGTISPPMSSGRNAGMWRVGSPAGMPPNRLPMVSTGSPSATTAAVPATRAMIVPGTRFETRVRIRMIASDATASAVACPDQVPAAPASARRRGRNSPGTRSSCKPKKSRICVLAMSTAIPFVNPTTTGLGMKRTADPMPVSPSARSRRPAMNVQTNRPSTP
jgi:hypothetical protein